MTSGFSVSISGTYHDNYTTFIVQTLIVAPFPGYLVSILGTSVLLFPWSEFIQRMLENRTHGMEGCSGLSLGAFRSGKRGAGGESFLLFSFFLSSSSFSSSILFFLFLLAKRSGRNPFLCANYGFDETNTVFLSGFSNRYGSVMGGGSIFFGTGWCLACVTIDTSCCNGM